MSLFNIEKVQKQLTWLTEQIRCLKLEIGTGGLYSIGAIEISLPQLEVLTQDPLVKASLEINAMPKLALTGDFVVFFKTYIGEDIYITTFNNKKFLGTIGQGGDTLISSENLMLTSSIKPVIIPTLQQVLDADGNYVYAEFPSGAYIEDDEGGFSIQNGNSFFRVNDNGGLEIDSDKLKIKNSSPSDENKILRVNAQGFFELDYETPQLSRHSQLDLDDGTNPHNTTYEDLQDKPNLTDPTKQWIFLASHFSVEPEEVAIIDDGTVFKYTLEGVERFRLVPEPYVPTEDAFFEAFDGTTLTNLIIKRG